MNLNEQLYFLPVKRMDISNYGSENMSNCESEEEELPRPETVTVVQDELEDSDPFPSHNVDPLSVDPLSLEHSIEPPCTPIKEELGDDSEVLVKIELSSSEDESFIFPSDHTLEDDGYRSASDQGVPNKGQPKSIRLSVAQSNINEESTNKLYEELVEVENANVQKGISSQEVIPELKRQQDHGDSATQGNAESSIDLRCTEVESGIVDQFYGSEVEVTKNQDKRATKESNVVRGPKATSCLEQENPHTLETPFADTRQTVIEKTFKSALNFPKNRRKSSASEERIEGVKLLPLRNSERKLKVVLTRCKEAEILVSSVKSTGMKNDNLVPAVNLSPTKLGENQMNFEECSRVETEKIAILKIRKNKDVNGWEMAYVGNEVLSKGTKSAKVLKTASAPKVEDDLVPVFESESETLISRDEAISRKEGQHFSEGREELREHQTVDGSGGTVRKFQLDHGNEGAVLQPWSCFICHKTFDNPFAMKGHIGHCKRRQKERISPTLTDLKDHSEVVHMYKCEVCAQEFASMKGMKSHKTQVGHNNDLKRNEKNSNCITSTTQLQDLQKLENSNVISVPVPLEKIVHEPQMAVFNNLSCMDNQSDLLNNNDSNTDFSQVLLSRSRNVYGCDICGMRFSNSLKLKVHALLHGKQTHHLNSLKEKLHQTSSKINVKEPSYRKGFQGHSNLRVEKKLYQCDKCPKAFYTSFNFKTHLNKHTGTGPYKCKMCGIAYYHRISLERHKKIHKHENKCGFCGMSFTDSEQLDNHKCSFTKPDTMIDKVSDNVLRSSDSNTSSSKCNDSNLEVNISNSKAEFISKKMIICTICGRTLASRISLKYHMYLHTGKPNACAICNKTFSTVARLKDHIRASHTFEKPYQCDLCDRAYAGCNSLRIHKKKKHKKNTKKDKSTKQKSIKQQKLKCQLIRKTLNCSECPAVLTTYASFKRHRMRFHLKQTNEEPLRIYKCEKCEASFRLHSTLNRHMKHFHVGEAKDMSIVKSPVSGCGENEKDITEVATNSSAAEYPGKHILDSGKQFQCHICNKAFSFLFRLKDHIRSCHTFETPYQCNLCNKVYSSSDSLRVHKKSKHMQGKMRTSVRGMQTKGGKMRMLQCDECPAKFSTAGYLLRHKKRSHLTNTKKESIEENKCEQNAASFQLIEYNHQINDHLMSGIIKGTSTSESYPERKPIECKYCTASYDYCKSFIKHLLQKHGIKEAAIRNNEADVECDLCHKRLVCNSSLKRHKREVHKVKETEQETSENVHPKHKAPFHLPDNLLRHTRQTEEINNTSTLNSQSSDQIYKCGICDAVFNQNSSLLEHKASFHVEKKKKNVDSKPSRRPYKCNLCNAKYFNKFSLERHKRSMHLEEDIFQCSVCQKEFSSAIVLIKHHEKHFKNLKHSCSKCGKSFEQLQHMEEHMLTHYNKTSLYHCNTCSLPFQTLDDLENHKRSHKFKSPLRVGQSKHREQVPRNHKCDVCNKSFSRKDALIRHKLIHTTICIYQCKICGQSFRDRYKLVLHTRTHSLCD